MYSVLRAQLRIHYWVASRSSRRSVNAVLLATEVRILMPTLPRYRSFAAGRIQSGDALVRHGYSNAERQGAMDQADELALLQQCRGRMLAESGQAPAGWLSPWTSESLHTPDLLAETGYGYRLQLVSRRAVAADAHALWQTAVGRAVSASVDNIPMIMHRQMDGKDFAQMNIDQTDEMIEQAKSPSAAPLIMGVALHSYIVGQPYRLRHLRRAVQHVAAARPAVNCV